MNFDRELQHLQARANKLSLTQSPPNLQVIVTGANEEALEDLSPWKLLVKLEKRL